MACVQSSGPVEELPRLGRSIDGLVRTVSSLAQSQAIGIWSPSNTIKAGVDSLLQSFSLGEHVDSPPGTGLLVYLDEVGTCQMRFVEDTDAQSIHPNIRVPAVMKELEELYGGGSGVTVFKGYHPNFGQTVMKHGSYHDTGELFALATLKAQLKERGETNGAEDSAQNLWSRTPEFKFIYISQIHLRSRASTRWADLMKLFAPAAGRRNDNGSRFADTVNAVRRLKNGEKERSHHKVVGKVIRIRSPTKEEDVEHKDPVSIVGEKRLDVKASVNVYQIDGVVKGQDMACSEHSMGYPYLHDFVRQLMPMQRDQLWKFTLAQKAIGGGTKTTCAGLLAQGNLTFNTLEQICRQFIGILQDLQRVTYQDEVDITDRVRTEFSDTKNRGLGPGEISAVVDKYVGLAIKKNFTPKTGRFARLRTMGEAFRNGKFDLLPGEQLPGRLLGELLCPGAQMDLVFADSLVGATALDAVSNSWQPLLEQALNLQSSAAQSQVWTAGLTDSGLHNMFFDNGYLWLFDLGEPSCMTLPAFLTKFLMSFFHTLGMEDCEGGGWVKRFEEEQAEGGVLVQTQSPGSTRLKPTETTSLRLSEAESAFKFAINCFISEIFDGEEAVRHLLLRYAVLQLLSDAAFCLGTWELKGGGSERTCGPATQLDKWLWRVLWDLYAATYVLNRV